MGIGGGHIERTRSTICDDAGHTRIPTSSWRRDARSRCSSQAAQLRQQHGIETAVEAIVLGELDSAAALERRFDTHKIEPHIVITNAGFGLNSAFDDHDPVRLRAMLQLNVINLTETCDQYPDQASRDSLVSCPTLTTETSRIFQPGNRMNFRTFKIPSVLKPRIEGLISLKMNMLNQFDSVGMRAV